MTIPAKRVNSGMGTSSVPGRYYDLSLYSQYTAEPEIRFCAPSTPYAARPSIMMTADMAMMEMGT